MQNSPIRLEQDLLLTHTHTPQLKITDRLRRKEVEIKKATESIESLTAQLQHVGAERDSLHAQLRDIKNQYHQQRQKHEDVVQESGLRAKRAL